ncbi:rhomboid-domain-containing protein [Venturia nashicola]|uniref:Rhomboid-domain-containing protein n=1 Tax=Venturia nashicola TaxID=86259 RepID=A0A4Z1NZX3_9PEZI|nr:rhomboid-domain-containing protein [Venturia nashicola]
MAKQQPPSPSPKHVLSDAERKSRQDLVSIYTQALCRLEERYHQRRKQTQGLIYVLYAVNTAVFVAWMYSKIQAYQANDPTSTRKARQWRDFMEKNFMMSERNAREGRWWTNLTCAVSHQNPIHFAVNMFTMRNAASFVLVGMPQVGPLSFVALCVGSTLAAAAGSRLSSRLTAGGDSRSSLGASGMLCGILSAATCAYPKQLGLITAAWFAFDLGMVSTGGSVFSPLGHGAHLGGTVFGVLFYVAAIRRSTFPRFQ